MNVFMYSCDHLLEWYLVMIASATGSDKNNLPLFCGPLLSQKAGSAPVLPIMEWEWCGVARTV
jgi:hypothetical protein